ncbi:protein mono-ADP-ribosyltransferase PARP14-like isoform X3 [Haplochromis burtoni]|uniref:protein mono-ADP-ribosyltransferase PARP14-like isoform X3 n=1 Tax=Haplochromis burtoni TaxID=8153 RepID=UPI001C2CCCBD|nr:protein mono-ADP-ribosyltransferase PARP14-like isoform X3 [Haplochromis burtoni]
MDEYQYPLFFEATDFTDREKEKVRRYFQKSRDSGGGDCGNLEKLGGSVYKICFKEKEDQDRVLQRKFHTITLPSGEARLTVSRTSSPQTSDQPSTSQSLSSRNSNINGLEKTFRIDVFLLFFLRDNCKAYTIFEKQLSSIGCTVELNFDEEEVLVRGEVDKGPGGGFGGAAEKWECQVDRVFIRLTETYLCYHVLEPKLVKMILQDSAFKTDDIKVYTESGYAVVVGEVDAVKEKIAILEKSLPTKKEMPIVERNFKLIEEEFNREMRANCPKVTIIRGSAMITLEGPDKEVQSGAAKLVELIKNIKEKSIKFPTALLTFMKTSDAIPKYQTRFQQRLRNPVFFEVGADLVLSSLSSDALNMAEAAVMRDFKVTTVQLQGAIDLNRLKEILMKAKNEANSREFRMDISYMPGASGTSTTKVQLVGYSENVAKLNEVLHDFQLNQVSTQETINLLHPEMVDCFNKILDLIGMKQTKVTLQASHFPNPCVFVSGPRCHVQEAKEALTSTLDSVIVDTLTLDGPGAQQYFQEEGKVTKELIEGSCHVIIREKQTAATRNVQRPRNTSRLSDTPRSLSYSSSMYSTVGNSAINRTNLKIKLSSLENEQADVLVVPMLNKQLTSTNIGKSLLAKAGNILKLMFDSVLASCALAPGDVQLVDAPPSLGCSKIFFIECLPWDGVRGKSVQALGNCLKKCLELCAQLNLGSVAIPIIGPGIVLKYPLREAIQVLTDIIHQFGLSASSGSLTNIHIVIKPGYPDSEECYHDVYKQLSLNMNQGGQAIFRSLTSDLDDIIMTVGSGVKLHVVFGDITNETTDAVVNITDSQSFNFDISTLAEPQVAATVNRGEIFMTQSGNFPSKAILHVHGEQDEVLIEQLVCDIICYCESHEYSSVAIPAMCAGAGGLDPAIVAGAIFRGIESSASFMNSLTNIRLVLIKIDVFLTFKEEAMQMYSSAVINRVLPVLPVLPVQVQQQQPPLSVSAYLSSLHISSTSQQSVFTFLGLSKKDVDDAMEKLKHQYHTQYSSNTFSKEELEPLDQDDMMELKELVESEGLFMQTDQSGALTVSGLKDGVTRVMQKMNQCQLMALANEVRVREEEDLYLRVVWCILAHNGNWERLPRTANHQLENNELTEGITDAQGLTWEVNLQRMVATQQLNRQTTKLKRLENLADFTFPLYWDSMAASENMTVIPLESSSAEYRTVKEAFKRTVAKTVMKIDRLQNVHLRRAYEAQKKHISDKNAQEGGAGEKLLYHGTTQDNCDSIMKTGFNRRFAGQNATSYGRGTYFAVNANYSAQPTYSKPAADGSQLMFVARVLTGVCTHGRHDMKVPPPRNHQQPHDRYDSVVDRIDNPSMYVVFHDNQAYPDYLITFK